MLVHSLIHSHTRILWYIYIYVHHLSNPQTYLELFQRHVLCLQLFRRPAPICCLLLCISFIVSYNTTSCLAQHTHTRRDLLPLPHGNLQTTGPAAPSAPPQTQMRIGPRYQTSPSAGGSKTALPNETTVSHLSASLSPLSRSIS